MLCLQMSLTMRDKNSRNCLRGHHHHYHHHRQRHNRRHHHCQFINILMLSIMWTILFTETMAQPNLEALLSSNKLTNGIVQQQGQQQQQDLFSNEILTNANGEKLVNKLQKYHHNKPNYLSSWPGLRDLVLTLDYDDNNHVEESKEFLNTKFLERLRQLATSKLESNNINDNNDVLRCDNAATSTNFMCQKNLPSSNTLYPNQVKFKDHNIKKNVQFHKQCLPPGLSPEVVDASRREREKKEKAKAKKEAAAAAARQQQIPGVLKLPANTTKPIVNGLSAKTKALSLAAEKSNDTKKAIEALTKNLENNLNVQDGEQDLQKKCKKLNKKLREIEEIEKKIKSGALKKPEKD